MAQIKMGTVSLTVPDHIAPPEKAGNMTEVEVSRIAKAPRGLGLVAAACADTMEKLAEEGNSFSVPGVTPAEVRKGGAASEDVDLAIIDIESMLNRFKQANLLFDARAYDLLRQINDQVNAQSKRNPELLERFSVLVAYFKKKRGGGGKAGGAPEG
ncbi:MAG: hypothetical protein HY904_24420 [Deltaproteobacteria bacterium]|nr:hypothetical protein [Deltaproteobacteria bacterium]